MILDLALYRRALKLWGNTPMARKWLRAVAYLGDEWVFLQVPRDELRRQADWLNRVSEPPRIVSIKRSRK